MALDDLQDAIDRTMGAGDREEQLANLRRARQREADAHDAIRRREAREARPDASRGARSRRGSGA